jgi:flagellar basal-body rod protein FlgB
VFIGDVLNSGALPSLEATLRFAGDRHRLIAHNIANLSTPNFRQLDVSPAHFQSALARAIDARRQRSGGMTGALHLDGGRQIAMAADGRLTLTPSNPPRGVLFHDRNNRDVERLMQDHAENAGVYRIAADLLRSKYTQLKEAIGERV